ncbi:hypothetical protein FRX31_017646 [Thalictrum thalictroides]|uniref:Uncharacterized protein n=1 Tax=Thalictrum thalictroides TaxID=46969 RepID=A0A7J6W779_THATH|nr:hypothetical protein FRX31_017646 [Thalictrum thalictroides]
MILTRNDTDLQEKDTAIQAVGIVLHANLKSFKSGSTPTKIGWSIIFLFLSSKLIEELTWEIRNKSGPHYSWKKFSEEFLNYKNDGFRTVSPLAHAFLDTMQPFDPHSQVLLIECLLFLTSSCQIGRGWFMTTKLMVSKAVYSEDSESFQYALSGSSEQADVSQSFKQLYDFILAVVSEIMSRQRFVWAKRYKTNHQSLAVRLVSILGLVCLNSEEHFYQVQDVLRDAAGILLVLPPPFQLGLLNVIKGHMKSYKIFARLFAKALETIDNRLVLIHKDGTGRSFTYLKPKFINSVFFSQRKEVAYLMWFFQSELPESSHVHI